ncbi:MAG TPA: hypothetical protein VMU09_12110 [Acidimicrobiales bacterium]|nr:hypothetical protein [Acidimicrobiales bacterium]
MTPDDPIVPAAPGPEGDSWVSVNPGSPAGPPGGAGALLTVPPPDASGDEQSATPRRRRGRLVAAVAFMVLVAAGVTALVVWSTSGSSTSSVTGGAVAAERLVRASIVSAEAARTFHYVSTSTTQGITQTTVGDAAPDRGHQTITIGTHTFEVVVVGTAAYFKGDATTMQAELGLDQLVAEAHAGQWISLAPSDSPYDSVYAAVTTKSALDDTVTIAGKSVLSHATIGRTTVTPVRGLLTPVDQTPITGTARLDVRSARPHLPVRFTGTGTSNNQQTTLNVVFSQWGEPVAVTAPAGAIAYSSLQIGGLNPGSGGVVLT